MALTPFSATWRNDVVQLLNGGDNTSGALITTKAWTPTVGTSGTAFTSVSYATQAGQWVALDLRNTKFLVWAGFDLTFTPTIGSGSGTLNINGLSGVWTATADLSRYAGGVGQMTSAFSWTAGRTEIVPFVNSGNNTLSLRQLGSGANANSIGVTEMTTGSAHSVTGFVIFLATKT